MSTKLIAQGVLVVSMLLIMYGCKTTNVYTDSGGTENFSRAEIAEISSFVSIDGRTPASLNEDDHPNTCNCGN